MKVKVGAYCRVSTEKDDQLNSLESQKKYFTEYIKTNPDWELADIYADEGISGTQAENRTEFQRMISDARLKRLNLILTKEISRFARNTKVSLDYTRMLKELGVGVFFINDNINTMDGDGELRLTIMSAIAQEESRKTSQRVKWGQKRRMEQGVVFGREPFGYFLCNGVLSINEEEAETVRLIFQKFTLEGKGTHVIARELNEEGIQSKGFKRWTNTAILRLLKNEKYVGDLAQKKTITPDYLNHKKIQNRGQEELVYINNHHTPLISRELWDATQLQLQSRSASKEQRSKYSNRYWCSGKLVCGECGSKLAGRSKKLKNGEVYKAWRCSRARTYGSCRTNSEGDHIGCDNRSISHIALNEIVKFVLASVDLDKERILSELVSEIKKLDESCKVTDTESLYRKIAYLKSKKQEVINLLLEGCISKGDMALMNKKYDSLINNAEKDIKSLEVLSSKGSEKEMTLQVCKGRINSLLNMMTCREMEEVYKQTVNKIILNKDNTVELYLSGIKEPVKLHYASRGRRDNYTVECTFP